MKVLSLGILLLSATTAFAGKNYELASPDGRIKTNITVGSDLSYSISFKGRTVLDPSTISMTLENGTVWGQNPKATGWKTSSVNDFVPSPFYRDDKMKEVYNSGILTFKGGWSVEFRVFNDGVAYRFATTQKKPFNVKDEEVTYNFPSDYTAFVPYARSRETDPYFNSFEATYDKVKISEVDPSKVCFLPLVVDLGDNEKMLLSESDLLDFPGLYLANAGNGKGLSGRHPKYPKTKVQGGHNNLQMVVKDREDYIAKVKGARTFPWRMAVITDNDSQLAATNMSYLLASPNRLSDISWIKPGKVAWEWWNAWNLIGVDFEAGINNDTYKKYIDFAADNNIEYVILDEGWAVNKKADLMQIVPEIDIKELVEYGKKKNVDIVLWAGYHAFDRDMEKVCKYYSDLGVKGFKVDFMDRDDQEIADFVIRAAETAAKYHLFLDLHGMYKPAGINRTYPNLLNFEGVHGLENTKWNKKDVDQVEYDVMVPFTRQVAGPLDYTPGAMLNATKRAYYPNYYEPMSMGTRCRQLALFTVFDSPFTMLCDTPDNYIREPECTEFIAAVPTVWDETKILQGKMGDYIVTARRSGDTWYVAGLTDWSPRELTVDLSFLPAGSHKAVLFKDGVNASQNARDYKKENITVSADKPLKIKLAPGGGFAMTIK